MSVIKEGDEGELSCKDCKKTTPVIYQRVFSSYAFKTPLGIYKHTSADVLVAMCQLCHTPILIPHQHLQENDR